MTTHLSLLSLSLSLSLSSLSYLSIFLSPSLSSLSLFLLCSRVLQASSPLSSLPLSASNQRRRSFQSSLPLLLREEQVQKIRLTQKEEAGGLGGGGGDEREEGDEESTSPKLSRSRYNESGREQWRLFTVRFKKELKAQLLLNENCSNSL